MPPRLGLLCLLLLSGCGSLTALKTNKLIDQAELLRAARDEVVALPREIDKRLAEPYRVEPGDVVLVSPADYESSLRLPGDQPVLPDGSIQLGKFGRIQVAGKTLEEIENLVRKHLATGGEKEPPAMTARLISRQSKVYYVLGEVHSPGAFTLNGRETVLDAVLQAGGVNDRASQDRIILTRPTRPCSPRVVLPVCYRDITQVGDTATNYQIQPGDRIFVPSKTVLEMLRLWSNGSPCPPCGRSATAATLPTLSCEPACVGGEPAVVTIPALVAPR